MLDAALIHQYADPSIKPAIVGQFIAKVGSQEPLAVTVRSDSRVVPVSKPKAAEAALALICDNLGGNTLRVGITQYAVASASSKPGVVELCENIRIETSLCAEVFRIAMKWHGNPTAKEALP